MLFAHVLYKSHLVCFFMYAYNGFVLENFYQISHELPLNQIFASNDLSM